MIQTFFINLDRHQDRRAFIEGQLVDLGISAERISGVDGRELPSDIANSFSFADYLTPGQVGCSASHIKAWQIVRDRNIPAALILEDDAIISPDIAPVIADVLSSLPAGWDLVRLCRASKRAVKPIAKITGGRQLIRYSRIPVGRAGYLVSQSGAAKLLTPRHFECPGDVEIRHCWRLGLNVYGVEPVVISQERDVLPSTIGAQRGNFPRWRKLIPNPARIAYNMRQLGPLDWARCAALNATRHFTAQRSPTHSK